jgi:iron(III) transport system ATP-binding protein
MNHGVIEQIDTPHNIYYKPQTQFVAKFIGTMNFLKATCAVPNQLNVLGFIPLNLEQQKLKAGENYSIGFRPEAVELVDDFGSDKESLYLPVKVLSTEFLGAKRRLFCAIYIDGIEQAKNLLLI